MLPDLGFVDKPNDEPSWESKVALEEAWADDNMPIDSWVDLEYKDSDRLSNLLNEVLRQTSDKQVHYGWSDLFPFQCRRLLITEMVLPRLSDLVSDWIEAAVAALALPVDGEEPSIEGASGSEYEEHCAEILRTAGWETRSTPKSGDQGVDIIAERDGIRIAIQCKNYKQPVGNKAVQEVLAGKVLRAHGSGRCSQPCALHSGSERAGISNRRAAAAPPGIIRSRHTHPERPASNNGK